MSVYTAQEALSKYPTESKVWWRTVRNAIWDDGRLRDYELVNLRLWRTITVNLQTKDWLRYCSGGVRLWILVKSFGNSRLLLSFRNISALNSSILLWRATYVPVKSGCGSFNNKNWQHNSVEVCENYEEDGFLYTGKSLKSMLSIRMKRRTVSAHLPKADTQLHRGTIQIF